MKDESEMIFRLKLIVKWGELMRRHKSWVEHRSRVFHSSSSWSFLVIIHFDGCEKLASFHRLGTHIRSLFKRRNEDDYAAMSEMVMWKVDDGGWGAFGFRVKYANILYIVHRATTCNVHTSQPTMKWVENAKHNIFFELSSFPSLFSRSHFFSTVISAFLLL